MIESNPSRVARVSKTEAEFLSFVRAFFDTREHLAFAEVAKKQHDFPQMLSQGANECLESILARGTVRLLARSGARTRVWNRLAAPSIHFSVGAFKFLRWMYCESLATRAGEKDPTVYFNFKPSLAEELLLVLGCDLARSAGVAKPLFQQPSVKDSSLVALFHPEAFCDGSLSAGAPEKAAGKAAAAAAVVSKGLLVPSVEPLLGGAGGEWLEMLVTELSARWLAFERVKLTKTNVPARIATGAVEKALLDPIARLAPVESAVWILEALAPIPTHTWQTPLDKEASLGDRAKARQASVEPLRAVLELGKRFERARGVGYIEDDYREAQRICGILGPYKEFFQRAEEIVRDAERLE